MKTGFITKPDFGPTPAGEPHAGECMCHMHSPSSRGVDPYVVFCYWASSLPGSNTSNCQDPDLAHPTLITHVRASIRLQLSGYKCPFRDTAEGKRARAAAAKLVGV